MFTRLHGSISQKTTVIVFITVDSYKSYLLTPWSKVLLEKLSGSQSKNYPHFMEPESSLPYLQVPVPVLGQINPVHALILLPEDPS